MKLKEKYSYIFDEVSELMKSELTDNIFSVYDYDAMSLQELLCQFFTKINECVDVSNQTNTIAEWLVNTGLSQEVAKQLQIWLQEGIFEDIINVEIFADLNNKIDEVTESQKNYVEKSKIISEINSAADLINKDKYEIVGKVCGNMVFESDGIITRDGALQTLNVGQVEGYQGAKVPQISFTTNDFGGDSTGVIKKVPADGVTIDKSQFIMNLPTEGSGGNNGIILKGDGYTQVMSENKISLDAPLIGIFGDVDTVGGLNVGKSLNVNGDTFLQGVAVDGGLSVKGTTKLEGVNSKRNDVVSVFATEQLGIANKIFIKELQHDNPFTNAPMLAPAIAMGIRLIGASNNSLHIVKADNSRGDLYIGNLTSSNVACTHLGNINSAIIMETNFDGNNKNVGWSGSRFAMVSATNGYFNNLGTYAVDRAKGGKCFAGFDYHGTRIDDFNVVTREGEGNYIDVSSVNNGSYVIEDNDLTHLNVNSLLGLMIEEIKELKSRVAMLEGIKKE